MTDSNDEFYKLEEITRSQAAGICAVLGMLIGLMRAAGQFTPDAVQKMFEEARQLINHPEMAEFSRSDFLTIIRVIEITASKITPMSGG